MLVEINFSNIVPNLKIAFPIALNLVSKFASCHLAAIDITGTGFVLIIPYAEETAVVVIVQLEVRATRALL